MKDWSRERWRKAYLREAAQQRVMWSLLARGIRDYAVKLAEDDGTLVHTTSDGSALDVLVRVFGPHPHEVDATREACLVLLANGYLAQEGGRIWIVNLPAAQGDAGAVGASPIDAPLTQAERAKRYRRGLKGRDAASLSAVTERHGPSRNTVTDRHETPSRTVTPASRVLGQDLPSESLKTSQKNQPEEPEQSSDARDAASLSAVTDLRDEERDVTPRDAMPRNLDEALDLPICVRAERIMGNPTEADWTQPHKWPEVVAVAQAFAKAFGHPEPKLSQFARDSGVRAVVALYAAGYMPSVLVAVARALPNDPYWQKPGLRPGLASMTPDQVRRTQAADPLATEPSARVAQQLAERAARKAQESTQ